MIISCFGKMVRAYGTEEAKAIHAWLAQGICPGFWGGQAWINQWPVGALLPPYGDG